MTNEEAKLVWAIWLGFAMAFFLAALFRPFEAKRWSGSGLTKAAMVMMALAFPYVIACGFIYGWGN